MYLTRILKIYLILVLRYLVANGVFEEVSEEHYKNNELSEALKAGTPLSVAITHQTHDANYAAWYMSPLLYSFFLFMFCFNASFVICKITCLFFFRRGKILHAIQTGEPAFDKAFGCNYFE